ncbi:tripartite tricarboxylate transporter permease [Paenibacillus abyssi]|uniref:Membrane protein n=1 Tax=Paenibacillus abyssi TaxID=1340531 RepID=A0A917CXH9_9BACL|nr:tripartite tricarboxylate transporter permease [Paenibacillus abyssi]GGG01008.1 membrane protein [Paenibacillus abyssi]
MGFLGQIDTLLQWDYVVIMIGAVLFGLIIGILPGLGGSVTLALLIPITFSMSPEAAIVLLMSAYSAVNYGGSITSILVNTPGDAANAATTFDGYPLAKQGKAKMAISASIFASVLGGFIGLFLLDLLIPVARTLVLAFSYPEFFMLGLFGLTVIAVVTQGNTFRGLISGMFGLMLAYVGTDPLLGLDRFTFGSDYLWDGLSLVPVIIGLFAITEAFSLFTQQEAYGSDIKVGKKGAIEGIAAVFKNFWLFLRSCFIGIFIGIIPGVGGSVASFLSYGMAVQTSKNPEKFGKGAIEGVIAVESANDAKEGGSLLPTLAFGIPGSSAMAVLIGGLLMHGLAPGPEMLTTDIELTYLLIAAAIMGKIFAGVLSFVIGTRMVFITNIKGTLMAPGIIAIALVGCYATSGNIADVIVALVFGLIGFYFKKYGYSRIAMIIAMVLGGLIESSYYQSMATFGYSGFFTRPIALVLLGMTLLSIVWPYVRSQMKKSRGKGISA